MNRYFLENKTRLNKIRLVHRESCSLLPEREGRTDLGEHSDIQEVIEKARSQYPKIKLCKYCLGDFKDYQNQ